MFNKFNFEVDKKIFNIAWPTIVEQVLIMMVGVISAILVSRLGKESLAAVGIVNYMINLVQTIFTGVATGCMIVVARAMGESDIDHVKRVLIQALYIGVIIALVVFIPNYVCAGSIISFFYKSAEPEVLAIATDYYRLIYIGMPFVLVDMIVGGALRGIGNTKTPLIITATINVISFFLSCILIYGVNLPGVIVLRGFGVKGAAYAATIARIIGACLIIYVLFNKKANICLLIKDCFLVDIKIIKRIIKVGIPSFFENLILHGGFLVVQVVLSGIGTAQLAAYEVGGNIHGLVIMPILGIATTATALVGQNLGAENYKEADLYAVESRKLAIFIATILGVVEFAFAKQIASMFTSDVEVIKFSCIVIRGFAILEPFMGIERVCASVLRTAGDLLYVIITSAFALWLFRIAAVLVISKVLVLTLYLVMFGAIMDYAVRAFMYLMRLRTKDWKAMKV